MRSWRVVGGSISAWRRVAIEKLPRFKRRIERSESIGMLWIDLLLAFERAHHLPTNNRVRRLMPRYMTREQFLGMKEMFKCFLSPDEHREFLGDFLRRRRLVEEAAR